MKPGFGYYCSTLSFAQVRIPRCTVRLIFAGSAPVWVRVYEAGPSPLLLKTLTLVRQEQGEREYLDVIENVPGQSARVYAFWRDSV